MKKKENSNIEEVKVGSVKSLQELRSELLANMTAKFTIDGKLIELDLLKDKIVGKEVGHYAILPGPKGKKIVRYYGSKDLLLEIADVQGISHDREFSPIDVKEPEIIMGAAIAEILNNDDWREVLTGQGDGLLTSQPDTPQLPGPGVRTIVKKIPSDPVAQVDPEVSDLERVKSKSLLI